jgi:type I restriction enzyme, S subunit
MMGDKHNLTMVSSSSWPITRLKFCLSKMIGGGTPSTDKTEFWADMDDPSGVPWVAISDMTRQGRVIHTEKRITQLGLAERGLKVISAGSLIYSMYASLGKVSELGIDAVTNQAILGLVPNPHTTNTRFLYWWLDHIRPTVIAEASSNTQDNLNAEKVRNLPVILPPLQIQRCIADYLDQETAKIDALIDEKEQLLKLLDERRQALVTEAVTRGLDPIVPMKDSYLPWLGPVPTHWKEVPIRRLFRLVSGGTPAKDRPEFWEGDIPWVSAKDMKSFAIVSSEDRISEQGRKAANLELLNPGTILLVVRGMILAHTIPISVCKVQVTINQDMKGLVSLQRVVSDFVAFQLRANSAAFFATREESAHGTKALRTDDVKDICIWLPPLDEQNAIVRKAEHLQTEFSEHIAAIAAASSLLAQRRSSLIHEVVTGLMSVGGLV